MRKPSKYKLEDKTLTKVPFILIGLFIVFTLYIFAYIALLAIGDSRNVTYLGGGSENLRFPAYCIDRKDSTIAPASKTLTKTGLFFYPAIYLQFNILKLQTANGFNDIIIDGIYN